MRDCILLPDTEAATGRAHRLDLGRFRVVEASLADFGVAKYTPLFDHLCRAGDGPVRMSFAEIEQLVGPLPAAAREHAQWWLDERPGTKPVHTQAWLDTGRC